MSLLPTLMLSLTVAAAPQPGSEIVVILDNSGSMVTESRFNDDRVPPNDPERLAVLGALVVDSLDEGSDDQVTVIGFGERERDRPPSTVTQPDIRAWPYQSTFFRAPLQQALAIFGASQRETKVLIFFTDGVPSDMQTPDELRAIFDPAEHPEIDVLAVGLFNDPRIREAGSLYLQALVHDPAPGAGEFQEVGSPREIVSAFTSGYARAIGSRADTYTLGPGKSQTIKVGKYVSEVMVIAVSEQPGDPFIARLEGPDGSVSVAGEGDNGCPSSVGPPDICGGKRRHYQVFRSANDTSRRSTWTLSLPSAPGKVEIGVILRYDLTAELTVDSTVESGVGIPLEARMLFRGQTFDDTEFFGADGFSAVAEVEGEQIPLTHAGGGIFRGDWTPAVRVADETVSVEVVFANNWMRKSAGQRVVVQPPPYELRAVQDRLLLEPVPSRWPRDQLCTQLDLSPSRDIDDVELECEVTDLPLGVRFSCERTDPNTMTICGSTRHWCCARDGEIQVRVKGPGAPSPRTALDVPTRYVVPGAGFLRCHWLIWLLIAAALFAAWFLYGWIKPNNFESTVAVVIAGSERGLRRAAEQLLRELPGGKRGFYRDARLCLNGAGDVLRKPGRAALVLQADPGGRTRFRKGAGLEVRDRRTRKWKALEPGDFADGYNASVIYRLGDLYVKFSG